MNGLISDVDPNFASTLNLEFTDPFEFSFPWLPMTAKELPEGKILMEGPFTSINGMPSNGLIQLNANGSPDWAFPLDLAPQVLYPIPGIDGSLYGYLRDFVEDWDIFPDQPFRFGRRTPEGNFETFPIPDGFDEPSVLAIQPQNGRIILTLKPLSKPFDRTLFRLHPDGTLDASFEPARFSKVDTTAPSTSIHGAVVLDDGKILVGGTWDKINNFEPTAFFNQNLVRLLPNGTIDETFDSGPFGEGENTTFHLQRVGEHILAQDRTTVHMILLDGSFAPFIRFKHVQSSSLAATFGGSGNVYAVTREHIRPLDPNGVIQRSISIQPYAYGYLSYTPHLDGMLVSGIESIDGIPTPNRIARLRQIDALPIIFADERLETALQEALNLGDAPVTVSDLARVTELRLDDHSITDLRGLENARNLKILSINNNRVSNLTPLRELPLTEFSASNNRITDITGFTDLDVLFLNGNPIAKTSNLAIQPTPSGKVTISWPTETGQTYRLEESRDLQNWQRVTEE
ncbi:MAG: hypothetical protein ACKVHP_04575, partial [Verrucomicrobiales bacterium]